MIRTPLSAVVALVFGALCGPATAQISSPSAYPKGGHSQVRLVAGEITPSGKRRAGLEIVLAPGFKTYWRNPGDSGVPPVFDWSASQNVGNLTVRWPVPERFADGAGSSIGYAGEVIFPVTVQPADPAKPVSLVLKLDYAVCEKICIPAKAEVSIELPTVAGPRSERLAAFEARVPVAAEFDRARDGLSLTAAEARDGAEPFVRLVAALPKDGGIDDVFVEGPDGWAFGTAQLKPGTDGTVEILVPVGDKPKAWSGPVPLVLTLRGRPGPIETRIDLDFQSARP